MERFRSSSHRVFSVRSVFTFVLVVIITTLLWVTIGGQTAYAADPEANWTGESITFDNHGYNLTTTFKDATNTIPDGATVYQSPPQTTAGSSAKKVFIIYFSSGVDPPTATTAQYVEFNISNDNETSNAQNAKDIKLTIKGDEGLLSSCSVEGIGWIICPVSQFAAKGMDTLFDDVLSPMIEVKPSVLGDPNDSMFIAWNVIRNIANVAFVIAFLIIIYSQLTSLGLSNYGLKKLIPRLIIAAILVNISFIISALAIDISNILGYSVQNIFVGIRENLGGLTNDDVSGINAVSGQWVEVTGIILAGGGVVGGVAYAASGGLWLLIPLLLGLLSVLILVVVVLAARQAIIVILVIIAPLAFVANLLPNTEKWFDKWKDLFFTMLLFFPAFSLVFGGSQLAGQIIIKNAGDDIVVFLFGLAVQIAPLVITPLILKFSGSLLGRIAQITNNPSKGLLDRNKAWATNRAALTKERNLAGEGRRFNPTTWGAGMVRNSDFRKRRLQDRTNAYKQMGDNNYHASGKYEKIHELAEGAEFDKNTVQNRNAKHIEHLKTTPGSSLYDRAIISQASKSNLDAATNRTTQHYNERSFIEGNPLNTSLNNLEASKASLETSENDKTTYLNQQRLMAGSVLNRTVQPLERSKLRTESTQNQYANMVERMKLDPSSEMYHVAQGAQSSKEILEGSQGDVQALFDVQRRTAGTGLYASTSQLENSKAKAEGSKSLTAKFISNQKSTMGTELHTNVIAAEQAKSGAQIADARLTKVIDNYRAGFTVPEVLTMAPELQVISDQMNADTVMLAAEKQASNSAQYEIQRNIADVMKKGDPLSDKMLGIAQGVGGDTARFRAQAQFVKAATSLEQDALSSNVELLKEKSKQRGTNIKRYSNGILDAVLSGQFMYDSEIITPEMIKAATQAQAEEKNVPLLERMKGSRLIDQAMLREIFALNGPALKAAGAFGLVDDPTLNIDNFSTEEEFKQALSTQRVSNLANANSTGLAGLKFGWVANSLAEPENLHNNIQAVLREVQNGRKNDATKDEVKAGTMAEASLESAFKTVRGALENKDTLATMRDRESFLRTIEGELAKAFGVAPLPSEKLTLQFDADSYANVDLPKQSAVTPNPSDATDNNDDTTTPPTVV